LTVELNNPNPAKAIPPILKALLYFENTKLGFAMILPMTSKTIPTTMKNIGFVSV